MFSGHRMVKFQLSGAESLGTPAIFHSLFAAVLGITHDGVTHVSTVDPKLMGTAGDGMEGEFT